MNKELDEALIAAAKLVQEEGSAPDNMFHPEYGWLIIDGEGTEAGARWYKDNFEKDEK